MRNVEATAKNLEQWAQLDLPTATNWDKSGGYIAARMLRDLDAENAVLRSALEKVAYHLDQPELRRLLSQHE